MRISPGYGSGRDCVPAADTPSFLVQAHASAMEERAERGGKVEHKVRQIARRAMASGRVPSQPRRPRERRAGGAAAGFR